MYIPFLLSLDHITYFHTLFASFFFFFFFACRKVYTLPLSFGRFMDAWDANIYQSSRFSFFRMFVALVGLLAYSHLPLFLSLFLFLFLNTPSQHDTITITIFLLFLSLALIVVTVYIDTTLILYIYAHILPLISSNCIHA